tara:strand:+ start:666 stop:827 length:162 start_codon:yes stop_codon:yes gene_type:complete
MTKDNKLKTMTKVSDFPRKRSKHIGYGNGGADGITSNTIKNNKCIYPTKKKDK